QNNASAPPDLERELVGHGDDGLELLLLVLHHHRPPQLPSRQKSKPIAVRRVAKRKAAAHNISQEAIDRGQRMPGAASVIASAERARNIPLPATDGAVAEEAAARL